jgi:hypothetical protein
MEPSTGYIQPRPRKQPLTNEEIIALPVYQTLSDDMKIRILDAKPSFRDQYLTVVQKLIGNPENQNLKRKFNSIHRLGLAFSLPMRDEVVRDKVIKEVCENNNQKITEMMGLDVAIKQKIVILVREYNITEAKRILETAIAQTYPNTNSQSGGKSKKKSTSSSTKKKSTTSSTKKK